LFRTVICAGNQLITDGSVGQAMRILNLIREVIWSQGFKPDADVLFTITGVQYGEKLVKVLKVKRKRLLNETEKSR